MTYSFPELFIGGRPTKGETGETMPVFAPSSGEAFALPPEVAGLIAGYRDVHV